TAVLDDSIAGLRDPVHTEDPLAIGVFLELGSESAVALGSADGLAALLESSFGAKADRTPSLDAHTVLQRARLSALRGEDEPPFEQAVSALRTVGEPFWVANALLE